MYVSVRIHRFAAFGNSRGPSAGACDGGMGGKRGGAGLAVPDDPVAVPIIMYHGLLKDSKPRGNIYCPHRVRGGSIPEGARIIPSSLQDLLDYVYRGVPLAGKTDHDHL